MKTKKIIGYNYLHTHPGTEAKIRLRDPNLLEDDQVIVDRKDWDEVCRFFIKNPKLILQLEFESKKEIL